MGTALAQVCMALAAMPAAVAFQESRWILRRPRAASVRLSSLSMSSQSWMNVAFGLSFVLTKAAMAAREGKDAAAAQKVVRALFEHIPRDAILDAYAGATRKFQLPN